MPLPASPLVMNVGTLSTTVSTHNSSHGTGHNSDATPDPSPHTSHSNSDAYPRSLTNSSTPIRTTENKATLLYPSHERLHSARLLIQFVYNVAHRSVLHKIHINKLLTDMKDNKGLPLTIDIDSFYDDDSKGGDEHTHTGTVKSLRTSFSRGLISALHKHMLASRSGGNGGGHLNRGGGGQHNKSNKKNGLGRRSRGSSTDGDNEIEHGGDDDQRVSTQKMSTQKKDDQNDQGALAELLIDPAEDLFSLAPYNKAIHDDTLDEYNEYTNMPMIHGRSFVQNEPKPKNKRFVYSTICILVILNIYINTVYMLLYV